MAGWIGVITNAGASLLAEWVQESVLSIDSAEAGTGTYPDSTLMAKTALAEYKQAASIVSQTKIANGYKVKIQITAPENAYTLNQFGLKASVDGGTSVLLALFQNGDGIAIPSVSAAPDFVYSFYAILPIGNVNDMTVNIDTSALISQSTLEEKANMLTDWTVISSGSDLDSYTATGNFSAPTDAIAATITNAPDVNAFSLKVEEDSEGNLFQTAREIDGKTYFRYNTGSGWSSWKVIAAPDVLTQRNIYNGYDQASAGFALDARKGVDIAGLMLMEKGTVTLTNSKEFPFNNSIRSVNLVNERASTDYIVTTRVTSFTGNVGEIEISDKLVNGFKIAHTGSASSVTVEYMVTGGYYS